MLWLPCKSRLFSDVFDKLRISKPVGRDAMLALIPLYGFPRHRTGSAIRGPRVEPQSIQSTLQVENVTPGKWISVAQVRAQFAFADYTIREMSNRKGI